MNWKSVLVSSILMVLLLSLNQSIVFSVSYANVDASQANEMMNSNPDLVILDVRTWDEYVDGHIQNATLIPVGELEGRLSELNSQRPTLVYCRSGGRSSTTSQILVDHGFTEVYNMLEGITAWIAAGYPIVQIEVPKDYATIQAAINAANEGDTIFVSSGTYYEQVVVNKTVNLVGEDSETTIIDGYFADEDFPYGIKKRIILRIANNNVNVTGLTIQNGEKGVYLTEDADSTMITDCEIVENIWGIYAKSNDNLITRNIIANNTKLGVEIFASCGCSPVQGNVVTKNKFLNNGYGIWLSNSLGGQIYHNNLINNTLQIHIYGSESNWDDGYPSGGNYWSDYNGVDIYSGTHQNKAGYDWIGDTPYFIDENNQDNYPLTDPYVPERHEIRVTHRSLLEGYNEMLSDFYSFNLTYQTLQFNYSELQENYTSLQISYSTLQGLYDLSNSTYTSLMDELNNIRNLMYVFMATTVIFMISTVYLATKIKVFKVKNIANK